MQLFAVVAISVTVALSWGCSSHENDPDEQQLARINKELALLDEQVAALTRRLDKLDQPGQAAHDVPADPRNEGAAAATVASPGVAADHTIVIEASGSLSWNGKAIDSAALGRALRDQATSDPNVALTIRATPATPHGKLVEIIDLARQSGMRRIALE